MPPQAAKHRHHASRAVGSASGGASTGAVNTDVHKATASNKAKALTSPAVVDSLLSRKQRTFELMTFGYLAIHLLIQNLNIYQQALHRISFDVILVALAVLGRRLLSYPLGFEPPTAVAAGGSLPDKHAPGYASPASKSTALPAQQHGHVSAASGHGAQHGHLAAAKEGAPSTEGAPDGSPGKASLGGHSGRGFTGPDWITAQRMQTVVGGALFLLYVLLGARVLLRIAARGSLPVFGPGLVYPLLVTITLWVITLLSRPAPPGQGDGREGATHPHGGAMGTQGHGKEKGGANKRSGKEKGGAASSSKGGSTPNRDDGRNAATDSQAHDGHGHAGQASGHGAGAGQGAGGPAASSGPWAALWAWWLRDPVELAPANFCFAMLADVCTCAYFVGVLPLALVPLHFYYDGWHCAALVCYVSIGLLVLLLLTEMSTNLEGLCAISHGAGHWHRCRRVHPGGRLALPEEGFPLGHASHASNGVGSSSSNGGRAGTGGTPGGWQEGGSGATGSGAASLGKSDSFREKELGVAVWDSSLVPYEEGSLVVSQGWLYVAVCKTNLVAPGDSASAFVFWLCHNPTQVCDLLLLTQLCVVGSQQILMLNTRHWKAYAVMLLLNYCVLYMCLWSRRQMVARLHKSRAPAPVIV
eukprot:jgi/Mesvir1/13197/Mv06157-RA.1